MSATDFAPTQKRNPLLLALLILGVLLGGFIIFAAFWTDWLWFRSLGMGVVFTTQLAARVGLFVVFGLAMALIVGGNLWLAYRLRPSVRSADLSSQLLARFRDILDQRRRLAILAPAAAFGLLAGLSAASQSDTLLMWLNRTPFGSQDAYFNLDLGFFIFSYPWWRFIVSFVLIALVVGLVASAFMHLTTGAISATMFRRVGPRSRSKGTVHLSILAGLVLATYGVNILFDRWGIALTTGRQFTGVHFTDLNSRIPALLILAIIAFISAGLFFANAFLQRWSIPGVSLVLMIISGLILGGIYPWWIQTFDVNPNEPDKESSFISANIAATRHAFGVDKIEIEDYKAVATASAGQLKADAEALPAIRLMDPAVIAPAFEQLQQVRGYYAFPSVLDVDRYALDGQNTDSVVAVRELNIDGIREANWNNIHTVYTHGYGLVAAYGNKRLSNGEPQFFVGGIPTEGKLTEHQPRIYFGERALHYVVVGAPEGTPPVELDTPGGGDESTETKSTYTGLGGVPVGGFFNRLLYSVKFADVNLMLTDRVNSESKILYDRTPRERAQKVAPWLTFDSDAYPSVVDGRIVWVLDAYTTSANYPNSNLIDWEATTSALIEPQRTMLPTQANYVRNSVKAVVDAYDGTVKLYAWDESDPVLQTWQKVYPGTVLPKADISSELLKHLRYPQDMFKIQREILGRYHTTNSYTWFQNSDRWRVPADPKETTQKEPPYFLTIQWPGDTKAVFSQTSLFVPNARQNLAAYLAVNSDASDKDYGRLRILKLSDSEQVAGPAQTFNALSNDPKVAERLLPFTRQGNTRTIFGNLLTLPVGGGLLYVQPIYTRVENVDGSYPSLRFVAVRFGEHVGIGTTLQQALDQVFQGDSGVDTGENPMPEQPPGTNPSTPPTSPSPGSTPSVTPTTPPAGEAAAKAALAEAERLFTEADDALKAGDLATYQTRTNEAKAKVAEALRALG